MTVFVARPTSRIKIRENANFLREVFDLQDYECLPILLLLENGLSMIDPDFHYEIKPIHEMPNQVGLAQPSENRILIREDAYEGAVDGVGQHRFTIAHEIGHYLMHKKGVVSLARNEDNMFIPAYKQPEWQANTFAAELLAPPHIIRGMSPEEIRDKCGVSLQVARIQLNQIN